jgi:cell division protease FtsH
VSFEQSIDFGIIFGELLMSKENSAPSFPRFNWFYIFVIGWLFLLVYDFSQYRRNVETIPYSQFLTYVQQQQVDKLAIGNERIEGQLKSPKANGPREFVTNRVDDPGLADRLSKSNVTFTAVHESTLFRDILSWTIPALVLVAVWMFFLNRFGQMSRGSGMLPIGKSKAKIYVEKDLSTRFDDVAGVDEAKEELKEVVNFLKDPKRYSKLGGRMPKGVLLVGAPGTGKTLLARAVAGEARVPFFSINGSEFVELFVGLGAARVRDLFQTARGHSPCILFIDELDALGKARGLNAIAGSSNDEKEQTLNQLLAEMDGFDPSSGIVVVAATNRPEVLDPALLRAGRFDRQILVDKPDRLGRIKILEVHMKKVKLAPGVTAAHLAALTAGFSGADLANLVNEAALFATRRGADAVEEPDFTAALERIIAGVERRSRVLNPAERRRVAYHEMGHAVVALAMGENEAVHKVSIIPRGIGALGYTMRRPTEDRYLLAKRELESKLAIALGGRAAETLFFDDISTGAADDLDKATEIARAMITQYGMSSELGLAAYEREPTPLLGSQSRIRSYEYSEKTAESIDKEIQRLLNRSVTVATHVIRTNKDFVEECASILMAKETIDEHELKKLWDKSHQAQAAAENDEAHNVRRLSDFTGTA